MNASGLHATEISQQFAYYQNDSEFHQIMFVVLVEQL